MVLLALTDAVEDRAKPMHIRVVARDATSATSLGDSSSRRFVAAVKADFVDQLVARIEEFGFRSFVEELLVFGGSIRQQQTAARRNLERSRRVLIGADFPHEAETNIRAGEGARVVIVVDFAALMRARQQ